MKTNRARWIACLLACAIGVSLTACGKSNDSSKSSDNSAAAGDDSSEGTIASEDLAKMQKQNMTFEYALDMDDDESSGNEVKDEKGNVVTEVVKGNSKNNESSTAGSNGSGASGGDSYQANIKTFQAYWLDMSSGKNVVCNGDFLDVTFKIKDDAPDGNYALTAGANDFANWDAQSVPVSFVDGDIAVGSASEKTAGSAENGTFTIAAGTAKGNPGDEVTVRFDMSDNPGIVALIFRFKYDANALEVVNAEVGADCSNDIQMDVS